MLEERLGRPIELWPDYSSEGTSPLQGGIVPSDYVPP